MKVQDDKSRERIRNNGEVFTPSALVEEVLDSIPRHLWSDPEKTWLEPSCGDGNFLVAIHQRLMEGLRIWEPDDTKRHKHIIENMLYGIDVMTDNVTKCIERLNAAGLEHHIVCADALTYQFQFDEWQFPEPMFVWPNRIIPGSLD